MLAGFVFGIQIILLIVGFVLMAVLAYVWPIFYVLGTALVLFDVCWMIRILPTSLSWWAGFAVAVLGAILTVALIIGGWWLFSKLRTRAERKDTTREVWF